MKIAIYPGTFDPITNGHLDILERAMKLFDKVIITVARNSAKNPMFTEEERLEMIRKSVRRYKHVEVDSFAGLVVDYARRKKAVAIVRGLRAISDFEYEMQMALMNRHLQPAVETVFMMPAEQYTYVSSRLIKEVVALGGDVTGLVPAGVEARLNRKKRTQK